MTQQFNMHDQAIALEDKIRANRLLKLPVTWEDDIIFPYYDGLSILNIAQTILDIFGVDSPAPLDTAVWGGATATQQIDRVVLLLTDGLGYRLLHKFMQSDVNLQENIKSLTQGRGILPLTSTWPSTTAVALPTIWTGVPPAQHGMVATIMYLREFSMLANMLAYKPYTGIHREGVFDDWGLPGDQFVPVPGLAERLLEVDVETHLLLHKSLLGSGLSRILHRGVSQTHPHAGISDVWLRLRDVLAQTRGQRCYVSAYLPNVDTLSHLYGYDSKYVQAEVNHQFQMLSEILADPDYQDRRTLVMIMTDHGHHDAPDILNVDTHKQATTIRDGLRLAFGGDTRFAHLYLREATRQRVIDSLTRDFPDRFAWIEPKAALHTNIFGDVQPHPELIHRLGDLILLPKSESRLGDTLRSGNPGPISIHGGASDWEMLVPFIWRSM